jgi:glycosyltransferase involved in cell wall biosynthesis
MRRIAYVVAEYPVASQTFVHAELVALRRLGFDVQVVAFQRGRDGITFGAGPDGVPFEPVHIGREGAAKVLAAFDHLHGHFADFGVRALAGLAAEADRPFSFTAHAYDLFRQDAAVRPQEWAAVAGSVKRVVAISRFHRDFIRDRGVPEAKIVVIPNAASLAALIADAPAAPRALRRILAVGRPVPKKGFGVLANAWARARSSAPGLELDIIGGEGLVVDPPEGLRLWPMRDWDRVMEAMRRADVVVAPCVVAPDGDMDGIPTVLAEAGALRRPVIASRLSGIPDLVAHGVNGLLVPPGDVHALAMALVRLSQRPAELTRLGDAGPSLAAAHDANVVVRRLVYEAFAA